MRQCVVNDSDVSLGEEAYELMRRLFPLCRSLTGDGVRATLDVLDEYIPLARTELASGTRVFDWTVPDEWNIRDAYIAAADGTKVVDFQSSNLHVVSYSEPVHARLPFEELRRRLHTVADAPCVVPYKTSYYKRTWGFCLSHRQFLEMDDAEYDVVIDATLEPGHLTYAELELGGACDDEVLFSTYVCHPSLANDNLSGIAVATVVAKALAHRRLRRSYRFLFSPGTIGPLAWLSRNSDRLARIKHGLTVSCLGDGGPVIYKRSRRGNAEIDRAVEMALRDSQLPHRVVEFEPWGGDERQFCSPGFDLPLGALSRTPHAQYPGNHTSADGLDRIRPENLAASVRTCLDVVDVLETNHFPVNLSPYGEPQLGRRGLYRSEGGAVHAREDERAMLWVLNQGDGDRALVDIAAQSGIEYRRIHRAAERLQRAGLIANAQPHTNDGG